MKALFDDVSLASAVLVTNKYSTSFSAAVRLLSPRIRQDVYNIYGFVRLADEIVDSFGSYNREALFGRLKMDLEYALQDGISCNPLLNAFQHTVSRYAIPLELVDSFMRSMEADLTKTRYLTKQEYQEYIYGSADVVGLMCLMVFVNGDQARYEELKSGAMRLGSAFQKINFLRDIKADFEGLDRAYFPNADPARFDENQKQEIVAEIEQDLKAGLHDIARLPIEAKLGVYVAYVYYSRLLKKLKRVPATSILSCRIRVPAYEKLGLLAKGYFNYKLRLI